MVWIAHPVTRQIQLSAFYSLFEVHYEKGYEFPGESHNFWECLYVADGEVCVSGDERVYNLTRGSIIFHKPLELHKFIVTGEKGADLFIFSFTAEGPLTAWLGEKVFALTDSQQKLLQDLYAFARQSVRNAACCHAAESSADRGMEGPSGHSTEHPSGWNPDSYRRFLEPFGRLPAFSQTAASYLELLMLSLAEAGAVFSASSDPDAVLFSRAVNFLNSNIHRQPSVPEIARFYGVSESGLKRIFDKYAGISVHKYLLKLKIKAALQLLRGGETVSRTAEVLGFNSQSYFSRAFRRETGISPSQVYEEK